MILGVLAVQAERFRHRRTMAVDPVVSSLAAPVGAGCFADSAAAFRTPSGVRYQLFRALRAMDKGEAMVVERRVPDAARHVANSRGREAWLRSLRHADAWRATADVVPLMVPGTSFPRVIGAIVIDAGWCAPSTEPHWVPNLRFFLLTEAGRETYRSARAWWQTLTPMQRMRAMLLE